LSENKTIPRAKCTEAMNEGLEQIIGKIGRWGRKSTEKTDGAEAGLGNILRDIHVSCCV